MASYYSGDLAEINRGRTADAAVRSAGNASFQNFLAQMAQDRTRRTLGEGELEVRRGELGLRGELGRGEIGVRRELGLGELDLGRQRVGEQSADRGVRRELGLGALQQAETQSVRENAMLSEQLKQQAALKAQELATLKAFYLQGGGRDPRLAETIRRSEENLQMLNAEADAASVMANADLDGELDKRAGEWFQLRSGVNERFKANPIPVVGSVLSGLGDQAPMVRFDPTTRQFMPRSFSTPGINPTIPAQPTGTNRVPSGLPAWADYLQRRNQQ